MIKHDIEIIYKHDLSLMSNYKTGNAIIKINKMKKNIFLSQNYFLPSELIVLPQGATFPHVG